MRRIRTKLRRRGPSLTEATGPSPAYLARAELQQECIDELTAEQAELVHEYGFDRAMRAMRLGYGFEATRRYLEAERQRNERLRWANGGRLPEGC